MQDTSNQPQPSTQGQYRRAFQKVKLANKKLSKELAKAQSEIRQRCQSYMMEISRLKQARPDYKPQRLRNMDFQQRQVDLKIIPLSYPSSPTSCSASSQFGHKSLYDFSTAKATRLQSNDFTDTPLTHSKPLHNSNIEKTVATSRFNQEEKDEQIDKLRTQLNKIREEHKKQRESRQSQRFSETSQSDSVAMDVEQVRKQFDEEMRIAEEKIYVYEAIFANIYNLLLKDKKDTVRTVEQIRCIKYNQLESKLKALFGLIRLNQDNVVLIEREKEELLKQTQYLSAKVRELSKDTLTKKDSSGQSRLCEPIYYKPQPVLTKTKTSETIQISLPSAKIYLNLQGGDTELTRKRQQAISKIKDLYDEKISEKYKQIATLKSTLNSLVEELSTSVFNPEGGNITRVAKQLIEEDSQVNSNDSFTKRHFTRKKVLKKSTSQSKLHSQSAHFLSDERQKHLIVQVLKLNRELAKPQQIIYERDSVNYADN